MSPFCRSVLIFYSNRQCKVCDVFVVIFSFISFIVLCDVAFPIDHRNIKQQIKFTIPKLKHVNKISYF